MQLSLSNKFLLRLTGPLAAAVLVAGALLAAFHLSAFAQTPSGQTPPAQPTSGDQAALGAQLYAENCAVCHGSQGQGRIGARLNKNWPSVRPDLTVRAIIARGVSGSPMPAWSQAYGGPLTDAEIDAIMQFILSWQTGGAPQITPAPTATLARPFTPPPQIQGDPNHGAVLYGENCDMCHGPNGEGRIGATLAKNWPGVRPDLSVHTTIANGIAGSPMPAWSQANGGPLSDQDINDLTAFILALGQSGLVVQVSPAAALPPAAANTALNGWAGVLLFLVLFVAIILVTVLLQRKRV